jgi:hypothetical protein
MGAKRYVSLCVLCTLAAGCNIYKYSAYNVITASGSTGNEACNLTENRHAAEAAWQEEKNRGCAGTNYSKDYACGFKDGYADFLDYGGTGLPPATPPFRYRTTCYQTPEGHQAIEEYNAGFAHGAAAARASGLRNLKVLPGVGVGLPPTRQELYVPPPGPRDGTPDGATLPAPAPAQPDTVAPPPENPKTSPPPTASNTPPTQAARFSPSTAPATSGFARPRGPQ